RAAILHTQPAVTTLAALSTALELRTFRPARFHIALWSLINSRPVAAFAAAVLIAITVIPVTVIPVTIIVVTIIAAIIVALAVVTLTIFSLAIIPTMIVAVFVVARILRAIAVVLLLQIALALIIRIPVAAIVALIGRQRRASRHITAIPVVPAIVAMRPARTPVMAPARRRVVIPAAEVRRRRAVITHRHAQHEPRHIIRLDVIPRAVVPVAHIPA